MRNPRIVRWDMAEVAYEANTTLERKHYYGDLRNPRDAVQQRLAKLKYDQTPKGVEEAYRKRVRGLIEGE